MAAQIEGTKWLILDTSHKTALPESLRQDATMNLYWACNVGQEASEDDRSGVFTRAFVDVLWTAYGPLTNDGLLTAIQSRIGAAASSESRADLDVEDLPMDPAEAPDDAQLPLPVFYGNRALPFLLAGGPLDDFDLSQRKHFPDATDERIRNTYRTLEASATQGLP